MNGSIEPARRLIIDTDTAGDDVTALLLALLDGRAAVEAVTIVAGNVPFDQQVENALYTIEQAGQSGRVPVYPGCRTPLCREVQHATAIHGEDGMGNSWFPKAVQRPETGTAVDAIIERVRARPAEITLVCIGPMTNLAVALQLAPDLAVGLRHVVAMGGAVFAEGNVTAAAEFNIWTDPEAADFVLRSGVPLVLVPWELTLRHTRLEPEFFEALGTPVARFVEKVHGVARAFDSAHWGSQGSLHPDALAIAVALEPAIATDMRHRNVRIETKGELTRGMTVVDHHAARGLTPNARVIYDVDQERFRGLLRDALGNPTA